MATNLLLVEDNEYVQRMFGRVFAAAEFTVTTATDGSEALQIAEVNKPDTIIMDVMMPNMNGLEALKALKENSETVAIPVVMLSAHDDETLMMQALQLGAKRYLLKSALEPDAIVTLVKEVLNKV